MAIHNENYNEILGLLGDMYVKYIDINNSVTSKASFIKKILKDISNGEIVDYPEINGEKKTLYGQGLNSTRTAVDTTTSHNINNDSFTGLVNQALYTKISNIVVKDESDVDNLEHTKGYLKFARGNGAGNNQVKISHNEENVFNLICSMNLVNVFIDILEAYNNFLTESRNIKHFKKYVNNIIIVNKTARDENGGTIENYGYWIDGENSVNQMSESTLFLSINSYNHQSDSGATATNNLFQDLRVKYNGPQNFVEGISASSEEIQTLPTSGSGGLFLANKIQLRANTGAATDTLSGIILKKIPDGRSVLKSYNTSDSKPEDIYLDDIGDTPIDNYASNEFYKVLLERDKRLLKNFLNVIINLDLINRKTQISGLLKFFKIIKEYFYIAITSGNILYNSVHNATTIGSTPTPCATANPNPGDCSYTISSVTESKSTGYGIKYLSKDLVLTTSTHIYGGTSGNTICTAIALAPIAAIGAIAGDGPSNSMLGLAIKENDRMYVPMIIENIANIHIESAKNANISNSDDLVLSDHGFLAQVLTDRTIRIKTRRNLFKYIQNLNDSLPAGEKISSTAIIKGNALYINSNSEDATITYAVNDYGSDDTDFTKDKVKDGGLPLNIKTLILSNKIEIANTHVISINNSTYPIEKIETNYDTNDIDFIIRARLQYPSQKDAALNDVPVLILPYNYTTLLKNGYELHGDANKSENYFGTFEKNNQVYFQAMNNGDIVGYDNKVTITIKKPLDYKTGYINNVDAINNINNQINSNQSKIKNIKTLYDLNKSKNNVLYYQLVGYIILLLGIIITLGLTYVMKMEKPIIKLVASVCFGIVVLQVVTYYILGVLYIENFTQANIIEQFGTLEDLTMNIDSAGTTTKEFIVDGTSDHGGKKTEYVNNLLLLLNNKIIKAVELSNVSVGQGDATSAYITLLGNTSSERDRRARVNSILSSESDGSLMHIDLLKYSASVYGVYIKTVLMVGLVITALFTINLYTDNKYIENIAFVGTFILVVIFAYYLIYSNSVVRTKSNNIYWGKENKSQYTDLK
jgi:hypothetical protein